jgi:hypothetical protein
LWCTPPPPPAHTPSLSLFVSATLPACGHTFCKECIQHAISVKKQCPVCKAPCERRALKDNHGINK